MTMTMPWHVKDKLHEARYFFGFMEFLEKKHVEGVRNHQPAFMGDQYLIARQYQYNFSALLSALRTVRYYVMEIAKRKGDEARAWEKGLDSTIVMKSFHALRNVDIHDQMLNIPQQHAFNIPGPGDDSEDPKFQENIAFVLSRDALAPLPRIQRHPTSSDILEYLTSRPLTDVAREALEAHEAAEREGRSLGHLLI